MPVFQSLTPNLVVSDIERSLSFYRFLNAQHAAAAEYPELAATVAGGSWTMFVTMTPSMTCTPPSRARRAS